MNTQPRPPTPKIILHDTPTASPALLEALNSHLPFSLPVLRRIQFASKFPGGSTPSTHILYATYDYDENHDTHAEENDATTKTNAKRKHFTAAYLDLSRYPETQAWIYNTLEDFYPDKTAPLPFKPESEPSEEEKAKSDALNMAVLRRMYEISCEPQPQSAGNTRKPQHKHTVLIGSLHETIRQRLLKMGIKMFKTSNIPPEVEWEFCGKWLFRVEELPDFAASVSRNGNGNGKRAGEGAARDECEVMEMELPLCRANNGHSNSNGPGTGTGNSNDDTGNENIKGDERDPQPTKIQIKFDKARREDVSLIRSRTSIDRKEDTLLRLPSLVVRRISPLPPPSTPRAENNTAEEQKETKEEPTPIAWAFTALDGSLMTLHVEPPYRGLGLAKLIASKIMKDHIKDYGPDGWGAADVFVQNTQSQGVCRSISGIKWWTLSWAVVDLASVSVP